MAQIEFRNAIYNAFGTVDVEINHPVYGWIPFTASPDDVEQLGKDIYAAAIADGNVNPYIPPEPVIIVPDRVSARQFGLQLIELGLKSSVDAWIATQDEKTQWAYQSSGTFVRTDPMMQAGFTALGFTTQQIDDFFLAASSL